MLPLTDTKIDTLIVTVNYKTSTLVTDLIAPPQISLFE
jgi:hypothetical protein